MGKYEAVADSNDNEWYEEGSQGQVSEVDPGQPFVTIVKPAMLRHFVCVCRFFHVENKCRWYMEQCRNCPKKQNKKKYS